MENKEIKIIRLKSGEDVIATFTENKKEKKVTLENPMHIIFKRSPSSKSNGPMMYMYPWVPVEMVKKDIAFIDSINVLTTFEPKGEMIECPKWKEKFQMSRKNRRSSFKFRGRKKRKAQR